MKITKPTYTMQLSEDELKEALEYWLLNKHKQFVNIKTLTHKTKSWTEGGGGMPEIDYSAPDGVSLKIEDK